MSDSHNTTSKGNTSVTAPGIGLGLLTTLFIGLKLTGHIDWSWVGVLAPLWLPFIGLVVTVLVVALIFVWDESR